MANQQLRVYAQPVALRCSELGRHNSDYNIEIKFELDNWLACVSGGDGGESLSQN